MGKATTSKETNPVPSQKGREVKPYLTKRILISAARQGFKKAAEETMKIMGYNVIARDGWVVKIYPDGTIEKISQLESDHDHQFRLALD